MADARPASASSAFGSRDLNGLVKNIATPFFDLIFIAAKGTYSLHLYLGLAIQYGNARQLAPFNPFQKGAARQRYITKRIPAASMV